MKILFVIPKNKSLFGDKGLTAHPHIGVAYLSAFLKQRDIEVGVFDAGIEKHDDAVIEAVSGFKPDIIGITVFSYCYGYAYDLIRSIRKGAFAAPIVLGGAHVSAIKGRILQDTQADFAVKQEGEYTLFEFLQEIASGSPDFKKVNGLIWNQAGRITENAGRPYICNLDELSFPDYEVFDIKRYPCYKQKSLPMITSRGCPFGCNYCSVRLSMGQNFRARSAQNVFSEIRHFYDKGFRAFDFNDDCFTLDKKRAEDICDLIIANKLDIKFQLYNGIRVDTITPQLLQKMKRAGCFFISYGCEAGNNKVLKSIKKGITIEQVREAVKWTKQAGIHNSVNFIIGHKEEAYNDALDTIRFAGSLPADFVNFYNLLPYPGTESFEWARQHANFLVPPESFLENISYRDNKPVFETTEFTKEQRQKIISLGFDLYRRRILAFRMGPVLGNLIYWATKVNVLNRLATNFALNNPFGRRIYMALSRRSYQSEAKSWLDIVAAEFRHPAIVLWRACELRQIADALKKFQLEKPILDLGCAEGKIASALFGQAQLFGLDNSWELLQKNKGRNAYKALVLADACRMPYKRAAFGAVFSNCVIEHIPDIGRLLDEASGILKEEGVFIFTVPSDKFADFLFFSVIFNKIGLQYVANWYKRRRNKMLQHFHCYGHDQWRAILKDHGFRMLVHEYYMPKSAAFIWDLLAAIVFVFERTPLKWFLPKLNWLARPALNRYYNKVSDAGAGLLIIAQKGAV